MLCNYKNSCFCLVVIEINVKILGNFWVSYQQMSFLGALDCILTALISKVYWTFGYEDDLTRIIWYPSNEILIY